jgi:hypothetical protein
LKENYFASHEDIQVWRAVRGIHFVRRRKSRSGRY